jgi:hypothetical protein
MTLIVTETIEVRVPNDEPDEARRRRAPECDQARLRRDSVPAKVRLTTVSLRARALPDPPHGGCPPRYARSARNFREEEPGGGSAIGRPV